MADYFPWLKNYDKGVPPTLQPYPQKTMIEIVDESAKAKPYRAMLYFKGAKVQYADFIRQSDALAAGLVAQGVQKGDRVAMLLPNCPRWSSGSRLSGRLAPSLCRSTRSTLNMRSSML